MSNPILGSPYTQGLPHFANPQITDVRKSPVLTFTADDHVDWTHGKSSNPDFIEMRLVCLVSEGGYAIGDEIFLNSYVHGGNDIGYTVHCSADQTKLTFVSGADFYSINNSNNNISGRTESSWGIRFIAGWFTTGDIIKSLDTMGYVPITKGTVNNEASIDINLSEHTSKYVSFLLRIRRLRGSTNASPNMRVSQDNGATFISSANHQAHGLYSNWAAPSHWSTYSDSFLRISNITIPSSPTAAAANVEIMIPNPDKLERFHINSHAWGNNTSSNLWFSEFMAELNSSYDGSAVTDIQIIMSSSNIYGEWWLEGIKEAI